MTRSSSAFEHTSLASFPSPRRRMLLRTGGLAAAAAAGPALPGCTLLHDEDYRGADAPTSRKWPDGPGMRPVALVLGSGGPRGFVHAGVLAALEELRLRPDMIVGSSIGSLVGALSASGMTGSDIRERALGVSFSELASVAVGARERFSGRPLAQWLNLSVGNRPIEKFPIHFAAVAYNETRGEVVTLNAGNAGVAVQASCAIPGSFTPVRIRGDLFVDPDLNAPLPVRVARSLGAAYVLSVDPSAHEDKAPPGAERYRTGDLLKRSLIEPDARAADINLHPFFGYWVNLSEDFRRRAIDAGYQETMAIAQKLRALWARRS